MFKKFYLSILTVLIFASTSGAQPICPLDGSGIPPKEVKSLEQLKRMATLQDGRVKPFETYAQTLLLRFSGKKRYEGEDAVHWVTRFFFAPQQTKDDRVFLINHPDIPEALGIEPVKDRRYSFAQIEPVFDRLNQLAMTAQQIDPKERDIVENELIRVHENVKLYSILSISYSFVFPHPDFTITDPDTIKELGLPENMTQFSFINIALKAQELHNIT
ncbi:MAG: hypothetical protein KC684_09120, partial [Candidatus Omnitrophica bacterium]|nr:hypothetical protein [Candidatus Omnitrophota bacterium]